MNATRCLKMSVLPLLVALPLMMAGCAKKPDGKYQDPGGMMSIDIVVTIAPLGPTSLPVAGTLFCARMRTV